MNQFAQDALCTESRVDTLAFSKANLATLLDVLIAAADAADVVKRAIYYGKGMQKRDELVSHLTSMQHGIDKLKSVMDRIEVPEDQPTALTTPNLRILHAAIGIFGESGELLAAVRKQIREGELDLVNVAEETGDIDWYKVLIHDESGISEEDTRAKVIAKLKERYPGKFTSDAALNRDLAAERVALENVTASIALAPLETQGFVGQLGTVVTEAAAEVVTQEAASDAVQDQAATDTPAQDEPVADDQPVAVDDSLGQDQ